MVVIVVVIVIEKTFVIELRIFDHDHDHDHDFFTVPNIDNFISIGGLNRPKDEDRIS